MLEFFQFVIRFFHGWRRRLGLAMLTMALGIPALSNYCIWSRSSVGYVHVGTTASGEYQTHTFSWPGRGRGFTWAVLRLPEDSGVRPGEFSSSTGWQFGKYTDFDSIALLEIQSHRQFGGFQVIKGKVKGKRRVVNIPISLVIVPDWVLILPLTLVSAFLLVVKPRPSAQKTTQEATANEKA